MNMTELPGRGINEAASSPDQNPIQAIESALMGMNFRPVEEGFPDLGVTGPYVISSPDDVDGYLETLEWGLIYPRNGQPDVISISRVVAGENGADLDPELRGILGQKIAIEKLYLLHYLGQSDDLSPTDVYRLTRGVVHQFGRSDVIDAEMSFAEESGNGDPSIVAGFVETYNGRLDGAFGGLVPIKDNRSYFDGDNTSLDEYAIGAGGFFAGGIGMRQVSRAAKVTTAIIAGGIALSGCVALPGEIVQLEEEQEERVNTPEEIVEGFVMPTATPEVGGQINLTEVPEIAKELNIYSSPEQIMEVLKSMQIEVVQEDLSIDGIRFIDPRSGENGVNAVVDFVIDQLEGEGIVGTAFVAEGYYFDKQEGQNFARGLIVFVDTENMGTIAVYGSDSETGALTWLGRGDGPIVPWTMRFAQEEDKNMLGAWTPDGLIPNFIFSDDGVVFISTLDGSRVPVPQEDYEKWGSGVLARMMPIDMERPVDREVVSEYDITTDLSSFDGLIIFGRYEDVRYGLQLEDGEMREVVELSTGKSYRWDEILAIMEGGDSSLNEELIGYVREVIGGKHIIDIFQDDPWLFLENVINEGGINELLENAGVETQGREIVLSSASGRQVIRVDDGVSQMRIDGRWVQIDEYRQGGLLVAGGVEYRLNSNNEWIQVVPELPSGLIAELKSTWGLDYYTEYNELIENASIFYSEERGEYTVKIGEYIELGTYNQESGEWESSIHARVSDEKFQEIIESQSTRSKTVQSYDSLIANAIANSQVAYLNYSSQESMSVGIVFGNSALEGPIHRFWTTEDDTNSHLVSGTTIRSELLGMRDLLEFWILISEDPIVQYSLVAITNEDPEGLVSEWASDEYADIDVLDEEYENSRKGNWESHVDFEQRIKELFQLATYDSETITIGNFTRISDYVVGIVNLYYREW